MSLKQLMSVPLKHVFQKYSIPVLLGLAVLAAFLSLSGVGHSRAKQQPAAMTALPQVTVAEVIHRRVRLLGGEDHDAVLIEDRAVGTDLSKKFVLTLTQNNRIEYRLIELGPEINGLRVVTQGLAPNDLIVVDGLQHVRPGQIVAATRVSMSDAAADPTSAPVASSPVDAVSRLAQAAVALRLAH
jgi:hypothetical protein